MTYIFVVLYTLPVRALPNLPSVILCRHAAAYQLATDGLISLNFHTLAIIIIIIVYTHTCCANISPSCGFYDIKTFISHICCKERKKKQNYNCNTWYMRYSIRRVLWNHFPAIAALSR